MKKILPTLIVTAATAKATEAGKIPATYLPLLPATK